MPARKSTVTDGKRIAVWRAIEGGADREKLAPKYGVTASSISYWYQKVNKDPALLAMAKSGDKVPLNANNISAKGVGGKKNGKPKGKRGKRKEWSTSLPSESKGSTSALVEEVKFLRWWNQGERQGFVDRLLKQIQE